MADSRNEALTGEYIYGLAEIETEEARNQWLNNRFITDWESGRRPKVCGINVMAEEVGKLQRCVNKLDIVLDDDQRHRWNTEAKHRIITTISMLRRLYQVWDELPDHEQGVRQSP